MNKTNKGFTLIELLVVIVIIGILATLATVALSTARVKARDAKRISDIKQMQTALELYYNEESTYPPTNALVAGQALVGAVSGKTFMGKIPGGPSSGETYTYKQINGGISYTLGYVLEKPVNEFAAGAAIAIPGSINNQCTPDCGGKYCGDADKCGGTCNGSIPAGLTGFTCNASNQITCGSTVGVVADGTFNTCSGSTLMCNAAAKCATNQTCASGTCFNNCSATVCGDCSTTACGSTCNTTITKNGTAGVSETYGTVQVGTQCWMTKNITNVGTMVNGGVYSNNAIVERWCPAASGGAAAAGTEADCTTYGALYAWTEAMYLPSSYYNTVFAGYTGSGVSSKRQGVCPVGWHLPSDYEWWLLESYLQLNATPTGVALASDSPDYYADNGSTGGATGWRGTNDATGPGAKLKSGGSSGLNIPLAGFWHGSSFYDRTTNAYSWSSSQLSATNAWSRSLNSSNSQSNRSNSSKTDGYSVRCLKD